MPVTGSLQFLDQLVLDWDNFETASLISQDALRRLAADKQAIRTLLCKVELQPHLLRLAERHPALDYIVVYDAIDRGFRIRIHISTNNHFDRPHDHKYPFSTIILRGGYKHIIYTPAARVGQERMADVSPGWRNYRNPERGRAVRIEDPIPVLARDEKVGDCYSLTDDILHSVVPNTDSVSLFLRGPACKNRSIVLDQESHTYWWRFGDEEPETRNRKQCMTRSEYTACCEHLNRLGVI